MSVGSEQERAEQDKRLLENLSRIKHTIIVMSGKGGVGKTTIAVNLACGLAAQGCTVGVLDIDIHGPNIPKMLGFEKERLSGSHLGIEPVSVLPNLKAVSIAGLLENRDHPVIWRGPLKMVTIKQFLSDVHWGRLDYLIIDSPPGTGDEPLSVCQLIPEMSGAVIVTTPQDVAILDSRKSILFARELNVPVIGVIENMSVFACPHCKKEIPLFSVGGGEKAAIDLGVPFLGRIPIEPAMVSAGDSGEPLIRLRKDTPAVHAMEQIVRRIVDHLQNNES
ncbi:MAG: Mrp/NBP35 family ATP-binding protein [Candidatus Omnitrophica bacterium]|nr:Mrp/NBP35 family ATP-binding protein [Candidatus Omnitrophota bacterium]